MSGSTLDPVETYLSLVTLQNLVARICHTMLAYVGVPGIWGRFLKLQDHVPPLKHASTLDELLRQICPLRLNGVDHSSSERSERFVRFEPNVRSERVRYFSERETNVQALKRLINLIAVK